MIHGIQTLTKTNNLAAVNELASGVYQDLPLGVGVINGVVSVCGGYRLFSYPAIKGRMQLVSQKIQSDCVLVECETASINLIGKDQYQHNFDHWAEDYCRVLCELDQSKE